LRLARLIRLLIQTESRFCEPGSRQVLEQEALANGLTAVSTAEMQTKSAILHYQFLAETLAKLIFFFATLPG